MLTRPCCGCGLCVHGVACFPAAAIPTQLCDPSYECQFTYVDKFGSSWTYDLSTLCNPQGNYQVRGGS